VGTDDDSYDGTTIGGGNIKGHNKQALIPGFSH
jgi:hypothetical protein